MIFIDFETRSKCVIQDTGAWRYAEDPSTDVLCMAYAIDDGPVEIWYPGEGFPFSSKSFTQQTFEAHHSFFERAIWRNIMVPRYGWPDIPDRQWACSAATAAYFALPRALDQIGRALNLKHQKDMSGKRIMMKLSRPRAKYAGDDPVEMWSNEEADFNVLYEYCKGDVSAERDIHTRLRPLPPQERAVWALDQAINERGIRVDMPAVKAALALLSENESRLKAEFLKLTGIESPKQTAVFKAWLAKNGCPLPSIDKNAVSGALQGVLSPAVRSALLIRQGLSQTSTAKYQAILDSVCADGRLRGLLMYHGASTGRWTGLLVQPQNLPRNTFTGDLDNYFDFLKVASMDDMLMVYGSVAKPISQTIRGVFIPAPGHVFVGGDYNAIEARVLFWLAGESRGLQMFREGQDIYKDMAATIYQKKFEDVTKQDRELGKRGILGCGYGMGWEKFIETCRVQAGLVLTKALSERAIESYRTKYRTVVVLWQNQEAAAKEAIQTKRLVKCGRVTWGVSDGFLFCRLPSGRCLAYYAPKIEMCQTSWGEMRPAITHMGMNSVTRQWERQSTYGGKIVENITQAVARDIMANAMLICEKNSFNVVLTVHDELLTEREIDQYGEEAGPLKDQMEDLMTKLPVWADGLPVRAEAWTGRRYSK